MARVYNFSAGPAVLPEEVLKEADFPQELIANTSLEKLQALLKRNKK